MKSNFEFLQDQYPILSKIGSTAETYLYTDSNACLIKLGMFGETVVNLMIKLDDIPPLQFDDTHANRVNALKEEDLLPHEIDEMVHALRIARNHALHQNIEDIEKSKTLLRTAYTLGVWFMQTYGNIDDRPEKFSLPSKDAPVKANLSPEDSATCETLALEQEELIKKLYLEIDTIKSDKISQSERLERSRNAVSKINLSEE